MRTHPSGLYKNFRPSKKRTLKFTYALTGLIVFCTILGGVFWHIKAPTPPPSPVILLDVPKPQYDDFKEAPSLALETSAAEEALVEDSYKDSDLVTIFKNTKAPPKIILLLERPEKKLKVPFTILKKHKEALVIKNQKDLKRAEQILKKKDQVILRIPPTSLKLVAPWIKKMQKKATFVGLEDLPSKGQKIDPKKIEKVPDRLA